MLSDETFYQEIQPEWRQAVKRIARGEPDRTDLMKSLSRVKERPISVRQIMAAVSHVSGIAVLAMTGHSINKKLSRARTLVVYLSVELRPDLTQGHIANALKRDRAIVKQSMRRAEKLKQDNDFVHWYGRAKRLLGVPDCDHGQAA